LTSGVWYYVRDASANTFKVSLTLGGAAVDLTTAGSAPSITSQSAIVYDNYHKNVVTRMNFRLGNSVVMRDDASANNAIAGWVCADRLSNGDFDPESVKEATHPFWTDYKSRKSKTAIVQVGNNTGNRCTITAKTNIDRLSYEDRAGRRIQNAQFSIRNAALGETPGSEFTLRFH
jgi:hypothetical protein